MTESEHAQAQNRAIYFTIGTVAWWWFSARFEPIIGDWVGLMMMVPIVGFVLLFLYKVFRLWRDEGWLN